MNHDKIILSVAAGLLLAACNNGQSADDAAQNEKSADDLQVAGVPDKVSSVAAESPPDEIKVGPGLQRLVDMAKQDLAGHLSVEPEAIRTVKADFVTWRDGSIGCPQPDMQYAQVLTHGARIWLGIGKETYYYHSGGARPPTLCLEPSDIDPLPYAPGEA